MKISKNDKLIHRETDLIILSAFVGAFMGSVVNHLIESDYFLYDLLMTILFMIVLYLTVPIALRRFRK